MSLITVEPYDFDVTLIKPAAEALRNGLLVACPTETVYGIACRSDDPEAIKRLLHLRGSSPTKNLSVHVADPSDAARYVEGELPAKAIRLMEVFWPGPLTIVVPDGKGSTVGLRCPNHPVVRALIREADCPVVMPSANRSGESPAADADTVQRAFPSGLEYIIDGGPARYEEASTVVELTGEGLIFHREGVIRSDVVKDALRKTLVFVCTGNTCRSPMAEALARKILAEAIGVAESDLLNLGYRILSAGVAAGYGGAVSPEAVEAVEQLGGKLEHHTSQPLTRVLIDDASDIFTMTDSHLQQVLMDSPTSEKKASLLVPDGTNIQDPIGGSLDVYLNTARQIEAAIRERVKDWII